MEDQAWKRLLDEAADIFMRLRENPEDGDAQADKAAFLARGEDASRAYLHIAKVWQASGPTKKANRTLPMVLIALCFGAALWGAPQIGVLAKANIIAWSATKHEVLSSGDTVDLDAGSALKDNSNIATRNIEMLQGAAFFSVNKDTRPFVVQIGELEVTVLGTQFETGYLDNDVIVAVHEGRVSVTNGEKSWDLTAGDRLVFTAQTGGVVEQVSDATIAAWRQEKFVADGLTFGQVAAVLDRRILGDVIILDQNLASVRVSGSYDLADPKSALRLLSATVGADVTALPPFVTLVTK